MLNSIKNFLTKKSYKKIETKDYEHMDNYELEKCIKEIKRDLKKLVKKYKKKQKKREKKGNN